jgi:hypothetical protein
LAYGFLRLEAHNESLARWTARDGVRFISGFHSSDDGRKSLPTQSFELLSLPRQYDAIVNRQ